jgi:hypothetical protein
MKMVTVKLPRKIHGKAFVWDSTVTPPILWLVRFAQQRQRLKGLPTGYRRTYHEWVLYRPPT